MALEKKIVGIPLAKGLNRKITDRNLPPGELTEVDNAHVVEGGELRKRTGFLSLPNAVPAVATGGSASTIDVGKSIAAYGDEVITFDGRHAYSKTSTDDQWVNKGRVVGCTLGNELVEAGTSFVQTSAQIAHANNFEVQVWSEIDPVEEGLATGSMPVATIPAGYTKADGLVECHTQDDHNVTIGSTVYITFQSWASGSYVVTGIINSNKFIIDYTTAVPGSPNTDSGVYALENASVWRTYGKVIDKNTRTEVVGKTLINEFNVANSLYSIPRAQVAASGQYVFIFVYVGSGRVKYTTVDTGAGTGSISEALIPDLLVNSSADVLFSVDLVNPDWCVEAVNNSTISNGICVFRRETATGQFLRLSYYSNTAGVLAESVVGNSPASINTLPHFPPATVGTASTWPNYPAVYPGPTAKGAMEVVGGLMLKVVTPSDSSTGDYIAIGFTRSIDATGIGGSDDEPGGVITRVFDASLSPQLSERVAYLDVWTTAFTSAASPGYVLLNGTAGKNESGDVRFFLTMAKNTINVRARSPQFLVNAYDYSLGGTSLTDVGLNLYGCTVSSDCFAYNSDLYLGIAYASRPNSTSGRISESTFNTSSGFIVDQQGQVVAKGPTSAGPWCQEIDFRFIQYAAGSRLHFMYGVPRVVSEGSGKYRFGSSRYNGINSGSDGVDLTAMDAAVGVFDLAPARYLPSVQANGALKVAGGILWDYSGDYFKEENFFWYPEIHSGKALSGGSLSGDFSYVAIYEWIDRNGKVQQSNPSLPFVASTLASNKFEVRVYNLHLTYKKDASNLIDPLGYIFDSLGKRSEVKIILYRTQNGKSIYHRCAEAVMSRTDRVQVIEDNLLDSNLADNDVLYTVGGAAGNICPPSQYDIAVWKDRVWLATTENTLWFSKSFKGDKGLGFNDSFTRSVDSESHRINGICPNREHLLVLGEKSCHYLSGDGPSDSGAGPSFSPMRVFASDQGAVPGSCRVETPAGVFFQSRQGLMLVGRNMQVSYKGAYAEGKFSVSDFLIDGHVVEDFHEVRFTGANSGVILVYNYVFDLWSVWTLNAALGDNAGSVIVDGVHYRLGTSGVTYKQHGSDYSDSHNGPVGYSLGFTTGWINVGQLQQLGRVYRLLFLGDYNAESKPQVLYYTDYNETASTVEMDTSPGTAKNQLVFKLPKQKVKALKFGFTETAVGEGGYMAVQGVSLLAGIKKPSTSFKFPTSDQIT